MPSTQTIQNAKDVKDFMSIGQLTTMANGTRARGDDKMFFVEKLEEMANIINGMPKTYEQDGKGDAAIVSLHYFMGGFDWYITEKDMTEGERQYQAFGYADMGHAELGYISIEEIINHGAELDLHFTPRTLGEVKAERGE